MNIPFLIVFILRRGFRALFLSHGVYLPMYVSMTLYQNVVCAPCWLGRSGQYLLRPPTWWHSWMPNACNLVIIFVLICAYTHLILIVLTMLLWLICVIVPMLEFVNKLVYSMRVHQNTWEECHRHEKGFGKETMRFGISIIFSIFGMDVGRCTDKLWQFFCTCAVVFLLK